MKITLDWFEVAACAETGVRRRVESIRRKTKDAPGFDRKDKWTIDIEGACGEMAAAKALGQYWDSSVNTYERADVGEYQVRTSRQVPPYLLVREANNPADLFILVSGEAPVYEVHGWMYGRDAMKKKYLKRFGTRPPVYAVPPANLKHLEELP